MRRIHRNYSGTLLQLVSYFPPPPGPDYDESSQYAQMRSILQKCKGKLQHLPATYRRDHPIQSSTWRQSIPYSANLSRRIRIRRRPACTCCGCSPLDICPGTSPHQLGTKTNVGKFFASTPCWHLDLRTLRYVLVTFPQHC